MLYAAYQCLKYHLDFQRSPGLGIERICEAENQPILRSLQRKSTHKDSWKPISYRLIFRNPPKYLVMYGWHIHWILVGGWTDPVWKICASQFEPFPHDIGVQNSKHLGKTTTYMKETHPDLTRESAPLRSTWLPCGTILRSPAKKQKKSRSLREEIIRNPSILEKCMDLFVFVCFLSYISWCSKGQRLGMQRIEKHSGFALSKGNRTHTTILR